MAPVHKIEGANGEASCADVAPGRAPSVDADDSCSDDRGGRAVDGSTLGTRVKDEANRAGSDAPWSNGGAAGAQPGARSGAGLSIRRWFTATPEARRRGDHRPMDRESRIDPIESEVWERRNAVISGEGGDVVFEQHDVEIPAAWSQLATNVVASKYFRGPLGTPQRETSVKQLIGRVVGSIRRWGEEQGYFATPGDADVFADELTHLLVKQKASFNSPVWFNVGVEEKPQCSACFILSVRDTMDSILDWYRREGVIFKGGSGSGVNLSTIRSSKERLGGGGTASGPVSFMRAADASAGVIKSGGKTRRAAKMVVLDVAHPDIVEFVNCKAEEEKKAWALIDAGYDGSLDGPAYSSIFFQNANNSVRVTDEFMRAVESDADWQTRFVTTGEPSESFRARELMKMIAEAAHFCGDPGMQFDTTINAWHTCPNTGRINASNPCSEYMHLDDSACNLASINLMKFLGENGELDTFSFRHAVDILITAQDIVVDASSYPTAEIGKNAHAFRELGLGYANLGALLMELGMPYDSEAGRQYAGAVTALLCGEAYLQSARVAAALGPFEGYAVNREPMLGVIEKHRSHAMKLSTTYVPLDLLHAARTAWDQALQMGREVGFRNSQATVLAPTGTIAFMMDCDTTGVEPDIALVKYKKLVGGGMLKMVNGTVPGALKRLGYDSKDVQAIVEYLESEDTVEGAPGLRDEHLPVFDCAFKPAKGSRAIAPEGHLRMMGAVQPFLSGAISKTINMPSDTTPENVLDAFMLAWKLGLKAVAIYRDGCKRTQPLNTSRESDKKTADAAPASAPVATVPVATPEFQPVRRRLPADCRSIRHKFDVAGHEGYIHVGFYDDGTPGEIFIKMAKEGSTISGLMDTIATLTSMSLQYGVPLDALVSKFGHVRFEPSGFTKNPEIPYAKSLTDYIFRFLGTRFMSADKRTLMGLGEASESAPTVQPLQAVSVSVETSQDGHVRATAGATIAFSPQADAPSCSDCGSIMIRNGSCYRCTNCGATSGCS
ncbi:vitamin B12-dependent ribonucleotide reductase [Candidatus Binatia bacterium]|nr:vitamin B12-dependent ribonucleotide reductase [Candidatus Binatia bacterium]